MFMTQMPFWYLIPDLEAEICCLQGCSIGADATSLLETSMDGIVFAIALRRFGYIIDIKAIFSSKLDDPRSK